MKDLFYQKVYIKGRYKKDLALMAYTPCHKGSWVTNMVFNVDTRGGRVFPNLIDVGDTKPDLRWVPNTGYKRLGNPKKLAINKQE